MNEYIFKILALYESKKIRHFIGPGLELAKTNQ